MSEKNSKNLALLPNGFIDLLPPFAEIEAKSIQILMDGFSSFGYKRIKPPLLEFEDSLLGKRAGDILSCNTFRLMDPISHRMLGVRSDITMQISRIVTSRMGNDSRPLRLSYANDVLRTRGSQVSSERQFAQIGCELIGDIDGCDGDIEACILAVLGLKSLGIKDITLDLTIPEFIPYLLSDIDNNDINIVEKAVKQRDIDVLSGYETPNIQLIAKAMNISGIEDLEKIEFDEYLHDRIENLKNIYTGIQAVLSDLDITDISLSIDLLEQKGFEYHKDFGFTLFAKNFQGELGRGGSYNAYFSDNGDNKDHEMARGFTFYMNNVLKIVNIKDDRKSIFVSNQYSWDIILDLQKQGWIVIRGAMPNNCSHIYKNGKIEELKSEDIL